MRAPFVSRTFLILCCAISCFAGSSARNAVAQTNPPTQAAGTASLNGGSGEGAEKLDPEVVKSLRQDARAQVLILGSSQLFPAPGGFAQFCKSHQDSKRRELRKEVVAQLKQIAAKEQPAILAAMGDSADKARKFWLVNAIAVQLTLKEIQEVVALNEVAYVYPAGRMNFPAPSGKVAEVLSEEPITPFEAGDKRIAWNLTEVGADKVWNDLKITGAGVTVVSFDSGVNYMHTDLKDHIWINAGEIANNGKDDDGNGYIDDLYGYNFAQMTPAVRASGDRQHGTMTTGILVGDGTGGLVTGAAPDARVMIIRAGSSPMLALVAYEYMIENGADVVNMSFSNPNLGNSRGLWRRMAEHATCAGLVQASGAGNFQRSAEIPVQLRVPEDIPCVIAAGGVNRERQVPSFSSLGPVEWGSVMFYNDHPMPKGLTKPDVAGFPGPNFPLLASADSGYLDPNTNTRGNSFSGPLAGGTAALMLSANPDLPAWRVKEILEETATDIEPAGKDNRTGAGLINALEAVKAAMAER